MSRCQWSSYGYSELLQDNGIAYRGWKLTLDLKDNLQCLLFFIEHMSFFSLMRLHITIHDFVPKLQQRVHGLITSLLKHIIYHSLNHFNRHYRIYSSHHLKVLESDYSNAVYFSNRILSPIFSNTGGDKRGLVKPSRSLLNGTASFLASITDLSLLHEEMMEAFYFMTMN